MKLLKLCIVAFIIMAASRCALDVNTNEQMYVSDVEYIAPNVYKYTVRATGGSPYSYLILYLDKPIYVVGDRVQFHTIPREEKK